MRFQQLYSGSEGNAYIVTASNGKKLLIEAGVTWPKLLAALKFDLNSIACCLISHFHLDHCKAVPQVLTAGIDCYASTETWMALELEDHRRAYNLLPTVTQKRDGFKFTAYQSNHDTPGSLLFHIECDNEHLLFATDTRSIKQKFEVPFDIIAIECNYDKEILRQREETGSISSELAKRLLTSHLEKSETIRYLQEFCDLSKCREINLLHLSEGNLGSHEKIVDEFENIFLIETRTVESAKTLPCKNHS